MDARETIRFELDILEFMKPFAGKNSILLKELYEKFNEVHPCVEEDFVTAINVLGVEELITVDAAYIDKRVVFGITRDGLRLHRSVYLKKYGF